MLLLLFPDVPIIADQQTAHDLLADKHAEKLRVERKTETAVKGNVPGRVWSCTRLSIASSKAVVNFSLW